MISLCFATNNANKLKEVEAALRGRFRIQTLSEIKCFDELPETSDTLEGNSFQKAAYVYEKFHTPCFADDTGLEVTALGGAPGVDSAHYAGPQRDSNDNIALLLRNLEPQQDRSARFRTVFTLVGLTEQPVYFEGEVKGTIIRERRGNGGFGYDPVFVPEGFSRTFAEMSMEEKNGLSHRSRALQKLSDYLLSLRPR